MKMLAYILVEREKLESGITLVKRVILFFVMVNGGDTYSSPTVWVLGLRRGLKACYLKKSYHLLTRRRLTYSFRRSTQHRDCSFQSFAGEHGPGLFTLSVLSMLVTNCYANTLMFAPACEHTLQRIHWQSGNWNKKTKTIRVKKIVSCRITMVHLKHTSKHNKGSVKDFIWFLPVF